VNREHLIAGMTILSILLGGGTAVGFGRAGEEAGLKEVMREALTAQALLAQGAYEHGFADGRRTCGS
jgi:hypothetical protein